MAKRVNLTENLINKIIHKTKGLFIKKTDSIKSVEAENVVEEPKKEINYEAITGCKKYSPKEETIAMIDKFEKNEKTNTFP